MASVGRISDDGRDGSLPDDENWNFKRNASRHRRGLLSDDHKENGKLDKHCDTIDKTIDSTISNSSMNMANVSYTFEEFYSAEDDTDDDTKTTGIRASSSGRGGGSNSVFKDVTNSNPSNRRQANLEVDDDKFEPENSTADMLVMGISGISMDDLQDLEDLSFESSASVGNGTNGNLTLDHEDEAGVFASTSHSGQGFNEDEEEEVETLRRRQQSVKSVFSVNSACPLNDSNDSFVKSKSPPLPEFLTTFFSLDGSMKESPTPPRVSSSFSAAWSESESDNAMTPSLNVTLLGENDNPNAATTDENEDPEGVKKLVKRLLDGIDFYNSGSSATLPSGAERTFDETGCDHVLGGNQNEAEKSSFEEIGCCTSIPERVSLTSSGCLNVRQSLPYNNVSSLLDTNDLSLAWDSEYDFALTRNMPASAYNSSIEWEVEAAAPLTRRKLSFDEERESFDEKSLPSSAVSNAASSYQLVFKDKSEDEDSQDLLVMGVSDISLDNLTNLNDWTMESRISASTPSSQEVGSFSGYSGEDAAKDFEPENGTDKAENDSRKSSFSRAQSIDLHQSAGESTSTALSSNCQSQALQPEKQRQSPHGDAYEDCRPVLIIDPADISIYSNFSDLNNLSFESSGVSHFDATFPVCFDKSENKEPILKLSDEKEGNDSWTTIIDTSIESTRDLSDCHLDLGKDDDKSQSGLPVGSLWNSSLLGILLDSQDMELPELHSSLKSNSPDKLEGAVEEDVQKEIQLADEKNEVCSQPERLLLLGKSTDSVGHGLEEEVAVKSTDDITEESGCESLPQQSPRMSLLASGFSVENDMHEDISKNVSIITPPIPDPNDGDDLLETTQTYQEIHLEKEDPNPADPVTLTSELVKNISVEAAHTPESSQSTSTLAQQLGLELTSKEKGECEDQLNSSFDKDVDGNDVSLEGMKRLFSDQSKMLVSDPCTRTQYSSEVYGNATASTSITTPSPDLDDFDPGLNPEESLSSIKTESGMMELGPVFLDNSEQKSAPSPCASDITPDENTLSTSTSEEESMSVFKPYKITLKAPRQSDLSKFSTPEKSSQDSFLKETIFSSRLDGTQQRSSGSKLLENTPENDEEDALMDAESFDFDVSLVTKEKSRPVDTEKVIGATCLSYMDDEVGSESATESCGFSDAFEGFGSEDSANNEDEDHWTISSDLIPKLNVLSVGVPHTYPVDPVTGEVQNPGNEFVDVSKHRNVLPLEFRDNNASKKRLTTFSKAPLSVRKKAIVLYDPVSVKQQDFYGDVQKTVSMMADTIENMPLPNEEMEEEVILPQESVTLYDHQMYGLRWLRWREQQFPGGGILADEMGLGKTIMIISLIQKSKMEQENQKAPTEEELESCIPSNGTVVVCPVTCLLSWKEEIKTKGHGLKVSIYHGSARSKMSAKKLARSNVVLTTYSTVVADLPKVATKSSKKKKEKESPLDKVYWNRIVLDEAHEIRNPKTAKANAIGKLRARHRWAVTGTPINNRPEDFYSMVKFLKMTPFDVINVWEEWIGLKKVKLEPDAQRRLYILGKALILRRTKQEVEDAGGNVQKIPPKRIETVEVELSVEERKIYNHLFQICKSGNGSDRELPMTRLIRLRQCAVLPYLISTMLEKDETPDDNVKFDELNDDHIISRMNPVMDRLYKSSKISKILEDLISLRRNAKLINQHMDKVVIISSWRTLLDILYEHLENRKFSSVFITGRETPAEKAESMRKFNSYPDKFQICLLSLVAGGVGINLVGGNRVFFVEPHWNPQLELQAQDRVHRFGQTKNVIIKRYIAKDTVEDQRILKVQADKRDLADGLLENTNTKKTDGYSAPKLKRLFK